jgi:dethiobiotin synthetase
MKYFVTGIDTDSGKTFVSAIFCKALQLAYWKPIQAGYPRDTESVQALVPEVVTFSERYLLKLPASPHASAKAEGVAITLDNFHLPETTQSILIEGAGGCLVPINERNFVIDIALKFEASVILVADLYLGSINHTLLAVEALRNRNANVLGIVFNGDSNPESESIILKHSGYRKLLHIKKEPFIDATVVTRYANQLLENLQHG